ncbi:putative receptor-like protein kinase [Acorus calamus]|uniref:Receptor-like protein kinase n=1 Tax=Acorus calamus TaxID=4465 RepID=A0AAV9F4Z4_ACOCL|nr:putative receptor-like protein kinase [Acorus calamus]
MGCFTGLRSKKKKPEQLSYSKSAKFYTKSPTTLPEPESHGRSLQSAPPSFRNRAKPVHPVNRVTNHRTRALSAPSSLHAVGGDALISVEFDDQADEFKSRVILAKDPSRSSNPQPLPLPSSPSTSVLTNMGSFKASNSSGPIYASGPLPLPPMGGLRNYSYEEIASACHHFSPEQCMSESLSFTAYKASFGDDASGTKRPEATVTRLLHSIQGHKEFINEVNTIASLQHPQLCKLLGFHAREGSPQRMLVYERLYHGSLDRLLYGRADGPPIDWGTRIKVALCAAQGLAFLHEEGPFQAMYYEFSTSNIQIDKDFSAKLSGYGCVGSNPEVEISSTSTASANLSVETLERGLLTPKSNVYSFGVVLLELLTGRRNLDSRHSKEERNLVKWSRPYLADDCRLSLIMDPRLKGRFPSKAARAIADMALKCLQKDPSERPTMRMLVEALKNVHDMKSTSRFPLQEPSAIAGRPMSRSPSLNGIIVTPVPPRPNLSLSPPSRVPRPSVSPTRVLPPHTCASTIVIEEIRTIGAAARKSVSPRVRRPGVEGF